MSQLAVAKARFDAFFDQPGDIRALALLRILVGPVVIYHLVPFVGEMLEGRYYADYFYDPWVPWLTPPPRALYFVLLTACLLSGCLMSLGFKTRWATSYTAFFVTYNFFLSETFFRHNRNFLVLVLWMLALLPCGRALSFDARRSMDPPDTSASLWPMYLMRFEVACVYYASSVSKLINPDWRSGKVLLGRSIWYEWKLRESALPDFVVDLVTNATFHGAFAKFAIVTEFLIATCLLVRKTRLLGIWVAISFHAIIEISLSVQIFSYLAIGGLLIWVTPRVRERRLLIDGSSRVGRRWSYWLRRLDWTARFRYECVDTAGFDTLELHDKDGRVFEGRRAKARALLLCPLTFWFAAPVVLWDELSRAPAAPEARIA